MFCNKCDNYNPEDQKVCSFCGAALNIEQHSYRTYSPEDQPIECDCKTHPQRKEIYPGFRLGVASFLLAMASFVIFSNFLISFPAAIAGLVTSCISRSRAKAFGKRNGFALAGLIASIISLTCIVIFFIIAVLLVLYGD